MPISAHAQETVSRMPRLPNNTVLERVRQALASARRTGDRKPGRPTLVRLIPGATEHQVRQAMAKLAAEPPPADHHYRTPQVTPPMSLSTTAVPPAAETSGVLPAPALAAGATNVRQPGRQAPPWPLILIGLAAAVAVWGGWVELGELTGFGMVQPLPGLVDSVRINTAIVLPIGIEAYGGYALRTWLSAATLSARTRRYARWSALVSLVVGAGAQVASHLMRAAELTAAPWPVTVLVACVPVAVLGLATGLATLVRQDTTSPAPPASSQD